jgi:hypothetical protein
MIELNQIGLAKDEKLYVHWDSASYQENKTIAGIIDDLTNKLKSNHFKRVII